ncbi:MAG: ribonuclease HIII [Planctomycetota bacterium]|nr:ribonuclease HIII [Planctomycetota bacterium]
MSTTLKLTPAEIGALHDALVGDGFEFRDLQYAHYQARGVGVIVSAYKSGKVVVQGKAAADFLARHGFAESAPAVLDGPVGGSDESGKGDYFGPIVVAAVVVTPAQVEELTRAGVRDCKQMSDGPVMRAAAAIRQLCAFKVCALTPTEYNARHEAEGNVALFLSTMHAEALAGAVLQDPSCEQLVIDQFTFVERLKEALRVAGVDLPVEIRPKAEDNIAVAAASVLARAEFLIGLRELGNEHGVELPKGASKQVEQVARRIFREGGMTALESVAKIHFKTTTRVTQQLF